MDEKKFAWDSRTQWVMALICQTLSTSAFISLPQVAVMNGALGYIIGYTILHLLLGIPLLYMECTVSQFTHRDCLQVWEARPCLSHIGYVQIFWQVIFLLYNHTLTSFTVHYILISFEDPVPYFNCGIWAGEECGILKHNFTLNQDCIKSISQGHDYCKFIYKTFPAYHYWRYVILGQNRTYFYVAWRVCLASAFTGVIMFVSCYRRRSSLKWFLRFITSFPIIGYTILMIGSLMQKGVVKWYPEAMDINFQAFKKKFILSDILEQVLLGLNIGTGLSFNLGSTSSFHAPLYANLVVALAICGVFALLAIFTIALMPCPLAYNTGIHPATFVNFPMAVLFEKIPTLLGEYEPKYAYLTIVYISNAVLALSTNIIMYHHMLEMMAERFSIVDKHPGFTCFICVSFLFLLTIPFLGNSGVYTIFHFKSTINLISTFLTVVEIVVFVLWYGLEKFSEDVHFMQGIRPGCFLKLIWVLSSVIMSYVFVTKLQMLYLENGGGMGALLGWYTLLLLIGWIVLVTLVRLAVAGVRKQFRTAVAVESSWGPRSAVLQRSRAMFTAQAMTKEYIYRQYHLQAGITARQNTSNQRRSHTNFE